MWLLVVEIKSCKSACTIPGVVLCLLDSEWGSGAGGADKQSVVSHSCWSCYCSNGDASHLPELLLAHPECFTAARWALATVMETLYYHNGERRCHIWCSPGCVSELGDVVLHDYHNEFSLFLQASARHQCSYLVQLHSSAFLLAGGDESWLRGIHRAPLKVQRLQTLNKLLAHRPWLITQAHIQVITDIKIHTLTTYQMDEYNMKS